MSKFFRLKWVRISSIVLLCLAVLYIAGCLLGARFAVVIPRYPLESPAPDALGLVYQDVSFSSRIDQIMLKGWYLPGENGSAVVIANGGYQNRVDKVADTLGLARDLSLKGYTVLLFDFRGRGESAGDGRTLSYSDRDLGGAVDFLGAQGFSPERTFILGFSTGAAATAFFASQNRIGAVVLDGCFASVYRLAVNQAHLRYVPEFLVNAFLPGVQKAANLMFGFNLVNPEDVISRIDCPIFFIHEQNDELITMDETELLYSLAVNPLNQIWEVRDARHSESYATHPEEYIARIDQFFTKVETYRTGAENIQPDAQPVLVR